MHKKTICLILAGGNGERFENTVAKQFIKLAGKPIIEHTIEAFEKHSLIDEIYLVVNASYIETAREIANRHCKVTKILAGGKTRQQSSMIGVLAVDEDIENILIHDAVRPFVSEQIITDVIKYLKEYPSVDVAIPTADTIIKVSDEKIITDVPQRKYLLRSQTPQGFWRSTINTGPSSSRKRWLSKRS